MLMQGIGLGGLQGRVITCCSLHEQYPKHVCPALLRGGRDAVKNKRGAHGEDVEFVVAFDCRAFLQPVSCKEQQCVPER